MGRFYQTADPQFLQDFVYKPPYEILLAGLQKEQNTYDTALASTNMFNNIDIDFIDDEKERERVRQLQDKYANQTEELSGKIRGEKDWKKYLPEIDRMSKDLHRDYSTGDIYTVQKSAANYKEMEKQLATIKDPAIKERAKQVFMDKWRESDRPVFEHQSVLDRRDLVADYLKTKSKGEADKIAKAWSNPGGGYIRSGEFTEKFINDTKTDFDNWLKQPEQLSYMDQQDKMLGLESYYDKNTGELMSFDDARSSAYHSKKHAISVADFNQQDRSASTNTDSAYFQRQQMASQRAATRQKQAEESAIPSVKANKLLQANPAHMQTLLYNVKELLMKGTNLDGTGGMRMDLARSFNDKPLQEQWNLLMNMTKDENFKKSNPTLHGVISQTVNKIDGNYTTSRELFENKYGATETNNFISNAQNLWTNKTKVLIGLGSEEELAEGSSTGFEGGFSEPLTMESMKNKLAKGEKVTVGGREISAINYMETGKNKIVPTFNSDISEKMNEQFLTRNIVITYPDGTEEVAPAHVPIKDFREGYN